MSSFLGSTVKISLAHGHVQGTLASIDAALGSLVLENSVSDSGMLSPYLVIKREDVQDLQLISVGAQSPPLPVGTGASATKNASFADPAILSMGRPSPALAETAVKANSYAGLRTHDAPSPIPSTSSRQVSQSRRRKQKKDAIPSFLHPRGSEADESTAPAHEDSIDESAGFLSEDEGLSTGREGTDNGKTLPPRVHATSKQVKKPGHQANGHPMEGEFDFASGLARFDKQRVFAEISALDKTDPALLLHAHNKRVKADARYTTKLLPTENVLDDDSAIEGHTSGAEPLLETPRGLVSPSNSGRMTRRVSTKAALSRFTVYGPQGKLQLLTSKQFNEVETIANVEMGPNVQQRIENGGRSIAELLLDPQAGFCSEDMVGDERPTVALLITALGYKGCCALRAGAHLLNRGVEVWAYIPASENLPATFEMCLRLFLAAEGTRVRSLESTLHAPDIIIDALEETEIASKGATRALALGAVHWANSLSAPTISIDWPSCHAASGELGKAGIVPIATVALGAIRKLAGAGPSATGALFLADVGLPRAAFQRVDGLEGWKQPFGRRWIVPLRFE